MVKNILITRAREKSVEMVKVLENSGFATFCEPLFMVEKFAVVERFAAVNFVIVTSANALYSLAQSNLEQNIKIYAIGKKTAEALKRQGFINVFYPEEYNALALKNLILQKEKPGCGLYFHGSLISLDFGQELAKYGFVIKNILSYKILENAGFSADLLNFTKTTDFTHILIFSKNSAKIFCQLAKTHNLLEYFKKSEILALSEKILDSLKDFGFTNSRLFTSLPILKNFYD